MSAAGISEAEAQPLRRRSGGKNRQRSVALAVRFSPEERAEVEAAAASAGVALGSYIRHQSLGGKRPRAVRRPPVEKEQLARILAALGKIGSNLNQIARASNMGLFTTGDYETLKEETAALGAARSALMEALGRSA